LKPQFITKRTHVLNNEIPAHKRYNSVNNRTISKYEKEYSNHLDADISAEE